MKHIVILVMVALATNLSLASASVLEEESKFKIIGIDVYEAGLYKDGSITVRIQNTGETNGSFYGFLQDCLPFEYSNPGWLPPTIELLPGEIGLWSLPIRVESFIKTGAYANICGAVQFYNNTTQRLENGRICAPNDLYLDKNFVKRCNKFGTDSDVIASCKRNITCGIKIHKHVYSAYYYDSVSKNASVALNSDTICIPDKIIDYHHDINICDDIKIVNYTRCDYRAMYDEEQGDFICLPRPEETPEYKNIDDPDCDDAFNYFDADLNACVQKPVCPSVIKNGNSEQKIDVVFVGDGYSSDKELKSDVLKIVGSAGLKSVEPFKSNWDEFNVWMINGRDRIPEDPDGGPDRSTSLEVASGCPFGDYQVILSEKSFRSYAYFSGDAYLSLGATPENEWGRLFLHEFGHSFGKLADEYVEPQLGNWPRQPNCAPNAETAREWWGGVPGTAFYDGCSYTETNVRPTSNSIMRDHRVLEDGYGEVNKAALLKLLDKYTG